MPRHTTTRLFAPIFCLLLLLGPAAASPVPQSSITVEDYCRLAQSLLELSVREWTERADLAAAHKSDRKQLNAQVEIVTKRYRPLREETYSRAGLSLAADLRYANEHQSEIESYLDENPDVRYSLTALKEQINALIEQFESVAPPPAEGASK